MSCIYVSLSQPCHIGDDSVEEVRGDSKAHGVGGREAGRRSGIAGLPGAEGRASGVDGLLKR